MRRSWNLIAQAIHVAGILTPWILARYLRLSRLSHQDEATPIARCPRCVLDDPGTDTARALRTWPGADVIVPVFNNAEDTAALLTSLRQNRSGIASIILIDDASTDPRVLPMLRDFAGEQPDVVLVANRKNLGFVGAVNLGLERSSRDVVLLNTDIELPPDAIPRIGRALHAADDIATATPFSNDAYGVGFPHLNIANARPFGATTDDIDLAFQKSCAPIPIDVPRGVGFCMGIRKDVLQKFGSFDPAFGSGYGEETDFCLRARAAGLRNVLVPDSYVFHKGGQSFGSSWREKARAGTLRVLMRHPGYPSMVADYLAAGEARAAGFVALAHLAALKTKQQIVVDGDPPPNESAGAAAVLKIDRDRESIIASLSQGRERYVYTFAHPRVLEAALDRLESIGSLIRRS